LRGATRATLPSIPEHKARRPAARKSAQESVAIPTTEEHRDQDCDAQPVRGTGEHRNLDATIAWLVHIAAGRIEIR